LLQDIEEMEAEEKQAKRNKRKHLLPLFVDGSVWIHQFIKKFLWKMVIV